MALVAGLRGHPRRVQGAASPSRLRADALVAKPHGIRRNRTFSAANDDRARRVRSSRAGHREFFRNSPRLRPSDGPRRHPPSRRPAAAARAHAADNGGIVRADAPCRSPSPDTGGPPPTPTNLGPHHDNHRCSTGTGDGRARTTVHSPSTGRGVDEYRLGLAFAMKRDHAEVGPREGLLPAVKSRSGTTYSAPGRS
jgi:hypothetical protein